ncbi:MAG: 2-oxo acid dehydrogenase subunit E2 [Actinobacteria bacterium]|nr:2-oxo acid dehydrogenase subunit E2 [Actinomycetota bacterium]
MPFIVKAVVTALKDYPALNASLDEEAGEIVFHDRYDIGIAVDTPAGLTVPVVRDEIRNVYETWRWISTAWRLRRVQVRPRRRICGALPSRSRARDPSAA